ncbi:3-hydroxybenzoate 6-monooxygenase [Pseudolabrys taiwanensis]|uniref:3-hydroxybenzoate 6-monooxygenase n=1 Tax=Pseudolabrys taiwanensis TaxID=331696 RepID=A0A345ZT05_9HYPH|nr:3-hydroxybenzoate 6-monooxygenase [Pseudolabrys taiwanensis]AXK80052.1 3-hydroxybenzoate 6-monooxygenase [Pseudolabrys taiwanensis]
MARGNGSAPFLISGGGIGGLIAAYALAQKGFPVRLFEQADEFREVGAGIQLGPNIFRMLEKIGLKDAVLADAHVPPAQEMRDALTGKLITAVPLSEAFQKRFGNQPYAVTHRADIHGTFLKACQDNDLITLETSRRVEDYTDHGDRVTVRLNNGEQVEGRALIGADGMWSNTRERIVNDGKPRVSGHIAYRAVLRRDQVPDDLWRPEVVLWAGPRTHFVHYPLRRGELFNLVAVFHSDHYEEGWDAEGSKDLLWQHFKMQVPEVLRLLERIETWRMWVLCDREPVKNWTQGNVTLLGDAAHPMLQYLAQGACMATEDAVVLADKIAAKPNDVKAAFLDYQQERYLRTARVQIMARVYGEFYHARGPAAELRDMMLAGRSEEASYDGIAWLYGGP